MENNEMENSKISACDWRIINEQVALGQAIIEFDRKYKKVTRIDGSTARYDTAYMHDYKFLQEDIDEINGVVNNLQFYANKIKKFADETAETLSTKLLSNKDILDITFPRVEGLKNDNGSSNETIMKCVKMYEFYFEILKDTLFNFRKRKIRGYKQSFLEKMNCATDLQVGNDGFECKEY